jgi:hypothetical protein
MQLTIGDKIVVVGNKFFALMGLDIVTGTVFGKPFGGIQGKAIHLKCDQTGCIEIVYLDDGEIYTQLKKVG